MPTYAERKGEDREAMVSAASGGSLRESTTDMNAIPTPIPLSPEPPPAPPAADTPSHTDVTVASDLPSHPDAERFARLLVSEIILYNEAAVTAGRHHSMVAIG